MKPLCFFVLLSKSFEGVEALLSSCSPNIIWDDTGDKEVTNGIEKLRLKLNQRVQRAMKETLVVIDRLGDGSKSSGIIP